MPDPFHPGVGRARRNAIVNVPGQRSIPESLALRELDLQRERNLREMFGGTTLVAKPSAVAKRAKELSQAAYKTAKNVHGVLRQVDLPTVDITLPGIALPNITIPSLNLPSVDLPNFDLPEFDFPDLDFPSIDIPGLGMLDLSIPGIRVVLQLLIDLFDGLDLPSIALEIGADFLVEFVGAALPVLGQLKSGAQAANEWRKAAKKAYQAYRVTGQKQVILTGDPRAAADAIQRLLQRAAVDHSAKATIKTVHFASSTAALVLDAGALSGPLISAGSALATLCLRVHAIAVAHKEKVAGNEALRNPGRLDATIFESCPTLGCYLLTCSNTSDVVNLLTGDIGKAGWMTQTEVMKRKIDPLLAEATRFIVSSSYELRGLKANKGIYMKKKTGLARFF